MHIENPEYQGKSLESYLLNIRENQNAALLITVV